MELKNLFVSLCKLGLDWVSNMGKVLKEIDDNTVSLETLENG
jgi:hypothetical protein